jgi:peptidoglycan/xylan/chitin deacetylase (PgdA/CDA1 family)
MRNGTGTLRFVLALAIGCLALPTNSDAAWTWPNNAVAAVSLTYDDSVASGLDHAMPDLEERGLRGTFNLWVNTWPAKNRTVEWKAAFERGHEIGSHSMRHPCRLWDPPPSWNRYPLEDYSPAGIMQELDEAARWLLSNIGSDPLRTYAYPCSHTSIGDPPDEDSYLKAVRKYHFAA